jgi:dihydroorotate dehydrogenase electron transfer subunit
MQTAKGCITEIYLDDRRAARISCPPALIPAPGQYLLATASSDIDAPLAQPLYSAAACPGGFYAAPPLPSHWLPGAELNLRGPLGRGFSLPASARQVVLATFDGACARVLALLEPALAQKASIVLLTDQPPAGLPAALEILPLTALPETAPWATYLAIELQRKHLPQLINLLTVYPASDYTQTKPIPPRGGSAQVLVDTPMPCGGLAECGACAIILRPGSEFKLACKDGPVFDLY